MAYLPIPPGGFLLSRQPTELNLSVGESAYITATAVTYQLPHTVINPADYGCGIVWDTAATAYISLNTRVGPTVLVTGENETQNSNVMCSMYLLSYGPDVGWDGSNVVATPIYVTTTSPPSTTYTVSYNANGGTGTAPATQSGAASYTVAANTFTRVGYTFAGWNTTADSSGTNYAVGATITPIANVMLYAKWAIIPTYTVTFDTRGGEPVPDQIVESGSKCHKPVTAQYHGYKLLGWYTDTLYTSTFDFDTPITANITLYAKWKDLKVYTSCGKWIVSKITYEQGAEKLTLHCVSLASKLDKQYYRGIHGTQNVTAIIADIFDAAKVSSSNIDSASITDRFGSATSSIPIPVCTCREALAYICSAFGCHLEITRAFKFTFKRNRISTPTQKLTTLGTPYATGSDLYTDDPSADNEDIVRVGTGLSYNYKVASSATNIEDGTTMTFESAAVGEYQDFVLEHDAISTSGFSLTASGADISNINSYAYATRFRATRTNSSSFDFTITLTGKLINITSKQKASVERAVSEYTEDNNGVLAYDNPVYQTSSILKRTLNEVVDTTNKPIVTITTRDDPKLLLGESVKLEGNFATNEAGLYTVIGAKRSIDGSNPTTYDLI